MRVVIELFYFYIELEPIGPMIDGDLVLTGTSIHNKYGPAFCTIEYASNRFVNSFICVYLLCYINIY